MDAKAEKRSYELLVSCLREPGRLVELNECDWDGVLPLARTLRLFSRLAAMAEEVGCMERLPPRILPHMEAVQRFVTHRQRRMRWEIHHLERALKDVRVPVLVLKGTAYLLADLRVSRGRIFGDVDVLVPKERIADVEQALRKAGWISDELSAHDERYYREWMHELPPMRHPTRMVEVDIHHSISPLTSRLHVDVSPFFPAARPVEGHAFLLPSAADLVLHSAVHLFYAGEFDHGLRDLSDLALMLDEFSEGNPDFFDALIDRAEALQLGRPLYYAFRYVHRILGAPISPAVLARVSPHAPAPLVVAALDWLIPAALMPKRQGAAWIETKLAQSVLWIRSHLLKMPLGLLLYHVVRKMGRGRSLPASNPPRAA